MVAARNGTRRIRRAVAQPNQQRPNRAAPRPQRHHADRQRDDHPRPPMLAPLPHQYRRHHASTVSSPKHQEWRVEEVVGFAAQVVVHPLDRLASCATTTWIGGADPRAPTDPTTMTRGPRPAERRKVAVPRLAERPLARVAVARSPLRPPGRPSPPRPCREHRARQPSGRTWTTIRRPHSAQNRAAQGPTGRLWASPCPPTPPCRRCRRRRRPERPELEPQFPFPVLTSWR